MSEVLKQLMDASQKPSKARKKAVKAAAESNINLSPIFQLDEQATLMFELVASHLEEKGLVESVDAITISMLAKNLSIYFSVAQMVNNAEDVIQTFDNGSSNVSGAFTALNKAQDQVMKLSAKLGLSPMDRTRILGAASNAMAAQQKAQDGDDIDGLM